MTAFSVGAQYHIILGGETCGQRDQRVGTNYTLQKFTKPTELLKAENPVIMTYFIGSLAVLLGRTIVIGMRHLLRQK
jgi:hypothetical protein